MIGSVYLLIFGIFFLCWGSFLNVVGYRIIKGISVVLPRSHCPQCQAFIKWYDLFPVISYILLRGHCRFCSQKISPLYPFIELLTMAVLIGSALCIPYPYTLGYFFFFSALIVCVRSDMETMLLSRYVTLYFTPVGWLCAYFQLIPLTTSESLIGSITGFGSLWIIAFIFKYFSKKEGLGQGDIDLMACIGAFTGLIGVWATLMIGSTAGALCSVAYCIMFKKNFNTPLPFGPFLACSAMVYIFMSYCGYSLMCLL